MSATYFKVNSITYAAKGRELLRRKGLPAVIERSRDPQPGEGCGYRIKVTENAEDAERILTENKIKITGVFRGEDD